MSCNHCGVKFNFFHKEVGCSNCGLSFCNRCLKQKCKIPGKGNGDYNVCRICYTKLAAGTSNSSGVTTPPPPDAYINVMENSKSDSYTSPAVKSTHTALAFIISPQLRRLEALENPAAPPITIYKQDPKIANLRIGLSPADQQLVDRLEKLKEKGKTPPPSEVELRKRLERLRGENDYVEGPSRPFYTPPDTRTDQQKADSLLEQFVNERDIEFSHNAQNEIEARLATLREQGVRPNESRYISELHDSASSEEEVDKITKKIMDEVALDERCPAPVTKKISSGSSVNDSEETTRSSPELPWCVLCNKDAQFRCLDCGGDLYCSECNTEVHKNWGDTDHHVVRYKQK